MSNFDNICRICAQGFSDLTCSISIFGESSSTYSLQTKISKYLYITVLEDDLLPKKICATCFLKIESIDKFAYSALKSQEAFATWLQKNRHTKVDVSQTTIETSTNSDFSFSNITIKKEFNNRQQIVFQPFKMRNPRHYDHITLEQIINDQIIKNPRLPAESSKTTEDEEIYKTVQASKSSDKISIASYHNLQIGQLIKDHELLKLILRALKWEKYDRKASYTELIERLRRSNCRDILTNKNLLSDNDVVQLLRSYMNDSMLMNLRGNNNLQPTQHSNAPGIFYPQQVLVVSPSDQVQSQPKSTQNSTVSTITEQQNQSIVQNFEMMELSVDPEMLLPDESITIEDDDDTVSAAEAKIELSKITDLPDEDITTGVVEENATETHDKVKEISHEELTSKTDFKDQPSLKSEASSKNSDERTLKGIVKKKRKLREENSRPKRKKIIIRINPSPSKRSTRDKTLSKFMCILCNKNLSSSRNLNLHYHTHKEKNGKFRCDGVGCKKLFGILENLLKHRAQIHGKVCKKRNHNEK